MNKQNPEEIFNIRESKGEDFYKIMIVNEALKNFEHKRDFPWLLLITIDIEDAVEPYKLPTDTEAEILNSMEDNFTFIIGNVVKYQYVGRITDNGERQLYYYVEDPKQIHMTLNDHIEGGAYIREFQYDISQDPNWEKVSQFFNY